jgi:eukaryotic-like serine/threonine-protein kinase
LIFMSVIPDVAGFTREVALRALHAAGFTLRGETTQFDPDFDAGTAIGTDPPSGFEVGTEVPIIILNISEGPMPPTVPDVVGLSGQDGVATLRAAGYQVTSSFETSGEDDGGKVVSQSPAGGSFAFPPGPVHVGIGAPPVIPPPVTVPQTGTGSTSR